MAHTKSIMRKAHKDLDTPEIKEMMGDIEVIRMKFTGPTPVDVIIIPPPPSLLPPGLKLPVIEQKPADLDIKPGTDALFELIVDDNTDVYVSWYKDKSLLLPTGRISMWNDGCRYCMKITKVTEDDESLYEYKVFNDAGERSGDIELLINEENDDDDDEEEEDDDDDDGGEDVSGAESVASDYRPSYIRDLPEEYSLIEGDRLTLVVETEGDPDVSWFYEGRKLKSNVGDFMKMTSKNNVHKLIVDETVTDDMGWYDCIASYDNDYRITTSTYVIIEGRVNQNSNPEEMNDHDLHYDMSSGDTTTIDHDRLDENIHHITCNGISARNNNDDDGEYDLINDTYNGDNDTTNGSFNGECDEKNYQYKGEYDKIIESYNNGGKYGEYDGGDNNEPLPLYLVSEAYPMDQSQVLALPVDKGDIVEVLSTQYANTWLVRDYTRKSRIGFVAASILEEAKS